MLHLSAFPVYSVVFDTFQHLDNPYILYVRAITCIVKSKALKYTAHIRIEMIVLGEFPKCDAHSLRDRQTDQFLYVCQFRLYHL